LKQRKDEVDEAVLYDLHYRKANDQEENGLNRSKELVANVKVNPTAWLKKVFGFKSPEKEKIFCRIQNRCLRPPALPAGQSSDLLQLESSPRTAHSKHPIGPYIRVW
jgi:hypothetical protein